MQAREKILICAGAYLMAATVWFTVASPAFTEAQEQMKQLADKNKENAELKLKLLELVQVEQEKRSLQNEIEQLRSAVPKSPDIDLLMIDLEKLCLDSGLDVVSLEEPDKDKLKQTELAQEEEPKTPAGKAGDKAKAQENVKNKPAGPAKEKAGPEVETGLEKAIRQITVTGSYAGCIELMKKLEDYQRVIEINQIEISFPTEGKEERKADSKQLKIAFLVTAYYLP